jgi:hypothetical protein
MLYAASAPPPSPHCFLCGRLHWPPSWPPLGASFLMAVARASNELDTRHPFQSRARGVHTAVLASGLLRPA